MFSVIWGHPIVGLSLILLNETSSLASLGQLSGGMERGGPELALREGAQRCHERNQHPLHPGAQQHNSLLQSLHG